MNRDRDFLLRVPESICMNTRSDYFYIILAWFGHADFDTSRFAWSLSSLNIQYANQQEKDSSSLVSSDCIHFPMSVRAVFIRQNSYSASSLCRVRIAAASSVLLLSLVLRRSLRGYVIVSIRGCRWWHSLWQLLRRLKLLLRLHSGGCVDGHWCRWNRLARCLLWYRKHHLLLLLLWHHLHLLHHWLHGLHHHGLLHHHSLLVKELLLLLLLLLLLGNRLRVRGSGLSRRAGRGCRRG